MVSLLRVTLFNSEEVLYLSLPHPAPPHEAPLSKEFPQTCVFYMVDSLPLVSPGKGFPGGSVDKESACNAGDPGLIPGSGRSSGQGNGNPL